MQRNSPPYSFSAPGIVEIVITGSGRVTGLEWIEASDRQSLEFSPFDIMNLPHPGGPRYLSMLSPLQRPNKRVKLQAPKRRPLQETLGAPLPTLAPTSTTLDETQRVASLTSELQDDLQSLSLIHI